MNTKLKATLFTCVMVNVVSALNPNHYYTSHGGFDNTCQSAPCPTCNTGHYRSGCGNSGETVTDAQKASDGTCRPCTLKPANSVYDSYPVGGTFSDASCPFSCNQGFVLSGGSCVPTGCTAPADITKELVPGTSPNAAVPCETRCKAGYRGNTASNPSTCTICGNGTSAVAGSVSCSSCNAGSFSAAGASACSPCPTGSFSSSSGVSQCTPCPAGTHGPSTGLTTCPNCDPLLGVPQYTTTQGNAACTPCVTCTTNGQYRDGCGRSSAGTCLACSN